MITTIVHLSEVANILEDVAGIYFAAKFIRDVLLNKNITVEDHIESAIFAEEWGDKRKRCSSLLNNEEERCE